MGYKIKYTIIKVKEKFLCPLLEIETKVIIM